MTLPQDWEEIVFDTADSSAAWGRIFECLLDLAQSVESPDELHRQTTVPDRLLSDAAWELWEQYPDSAQRTSAALKNWWSQPAREGRAVLILDSLSLRELPHLLSGARRRGIIPSAIRVTGSEAPSDTDMFARALGATSRSKLANNGAPANFILSGQDVFSDLLEMPFEDCLSRVPSERNVVEWHTWLDNLIHVHKRPEHIRKIVREALEGDGFWSFVNRLRQGRDLIITGDHGYAVTHLFSTEETEQDVVESVRDAFGRSRKRQAEGPWERPLMPPFVLTRNGYQMVMGQRKWKVQGGFPALTHGGLSLLEVAVPWIELPAMTGEGFRT